MASTAADVAAAMDAAPRDDPALLLAHAAPLLAEWKRMNRDAHVLVAARHKQVLASRADVDAAALALQHRLYEHAQLNAAIAAAQALDTMYEQVALRPIDAFMAHAPEEYRTAAVCADEHRVLLQRYQFELDERRRLEQACKALEEEAATQQQHASNAVRRLKQLQTTIDSLAASARHV